MSFQTRGEKKQETVFPPRTSFWVPVRVTNNMFLTWKGSPLHYGTPSPIVLQRGFLLLLWGTDPVSVSINYAIMSSTKIMNHSSVTISRVLMNGYQNSWEDIPTPSVPILGLRFRILPSDKDGSYEWPCVTVYLYYVSVVYWWLLTIAETIM